MKKNLWFVLALFIVGTFVIGCQQPAEEATEETEEERRKITITYDLNGDGGSIENTYIEEDSFFDLPVVESSRKNFGFLGWSTNRNSETPEFTKFSSASFSADTTLYAIWDDYKLKLYNWLNDRWVINSITCYYEKAEIEGTIYKSQELPVGQLDLDHFCSLGNSWYGLDLLKFEYDDNKAFHDIGIADGNGYKRKSTNINAQLTSFEYSWNNKAPYSETMYASSASFYMFGNTVNFSADINYFISYDLSNLSPTEWNFSRLFNPLETGSESFSFGSNTFSKESFYSFKDLKDEGINLNSIYFALENAYKSRYEKLFASGDVYVPGYLIPLFMKVNDKYFVVTIYNGLLEILIPSSIDNDHTKIEGKNNVGWVLKFEKENPIDDDDNDDSDDDDTSSFAGKYTYTPSGSSMGGSFVFNTNGSFEYDGTRLSAPKNGSYTLNGTILKMKFTAAGIEHEESFKISSSGTSVTFTLQDEKDVCMTFLTFFNNSGKELVFTKS